MLPISSLLGSVSSFFFVLLSFLFVLTVVVFVHELGHFLVARWCGVRVKTFSIGFGREVFGFNDRYGTRWRVSWIPLGGYVKFMDDENAASAPSSEALARMMLELQDMGCHNINLVTPEHVVPQILEALPFAVERGLQLPIVYNTGAYDALESLHLLDGIVDIYMPDFKFWDRELSLKYLRARDYPEVARAAIREMHRQVGDLVIGGDGLARRGLLVRHLVMPGGIAGTREIMRFLAEEISKDTYVNVMDQYYPAGRVSRERFFEINRRITRAEYDEAVRAALEAGLHRLDQPRRLAPVI